MQQCPKCKKPHKKPGKFCSRSCANSRGTRSSEFKRKVKETWAKKSKSEKESKTKIQKCPITGEDILNVNEYMSRQWTYLPAGRMRTIQMLADTFDISLGTRDTTCQLDYAREKIRKAYEDDCMSGVAVKNLFGIPCSDSHAVNFIKALGISRRSLRKAGLEAVRNGRTEIPTTDNTPYQSGWYVDWQGKQHFYRSSYEMLYYKRLDEQQADYDTESIRIEYYDTQKKCQRIAIPDIIVNNIIYEVKSRYTFDVQNMKDKFKSYQIQGYNLVLVLDHVEHKIETEMDLEI